MDKYKSAESDNLKLQEDAIAVQAQVKEQQTTLEDV